MVRSILTALCALFLSACAVMGAGAALDAASNIITSPAVSVVGDKVQLEGKRALVIASNAYQGAGALVVPLINEDKLTPAQVDRVEKLNAQAVALLAGTDKALSLAERAAGILSISDELTRIAGR